MRNERPPSATVLHDGGNLAPADAQVGQNVVLHRGEVTHGLALGHVRTNVGQKGRDDPVKPSVTLPALSVLPFVTLLKSRMCSPTRGRHLHSCKQATMQFGPGLRHFSTPPGIALYA